MNKIAIAQSDEEITKCFSVMRDLRPHLLADGFLARVKNLAETTGLRLAFLLDGEIKAVAGFRIGEWLAFDGKYLEIEDLVTKSGERSKGYGGELFDWLVAHAMENGCNQLRLVSNVARTDAHRFYERKGMTQVAHYFSMNLSRTVF
jgi:GNAT superfamily N-acetyltransferase